MERRATQTLARRSTEAGGSGPPRWLSPVAQGDAITWVASLVPYRRGCASADEPAACVAQDDVHAAGVTRLVRVGIARSHAVGPADSPRLSLKCRTHRV